MGDPFETCEMYAAGLVTRDELVEGLARRDYAPRAMSADLLDDLVMPAKGSVADLERALRRGLIDDELFDEVADRIEARRKA